MLNSKEMGQDNITVLRAIRIFNTLPLTSNGYSPLEIHFSFSADSLAFLSNSHKHPLNATRRSINLQIRKVKENERLKRQKDWLKINKNRKFFSGEVGDLCLVKARVQNKSKPLFGPELWKIVNKYTYTALLARISDNLTQCRSAGDIKVVFSPLSGKKIPDSVTKNFDLASYDSTTLRSQESLLLEPRMTRSKTRANEQLENLEGEGDEWDLDNFDLPEPTEYYQYDPVSFKKNVRFNPIVDEKIINGVF